MHRQQLELTDDLLLQGHWGKRGRGGPSAQVLNTLDNWGHKNSHPIKKEKDRKDGLKCHGPEHTRVTLFSLYFIYIYFLKLMSVIVSV